MEISTHNGPPSLRYAGAYGDDHDRNLQSLARDDIQVGDVGIILYERVINSETCIGIINDSQ